MIIPAFDEEGSVGKGVELLGMNDGSTDLTSEKAKARGAMQSGHKYTFEKGYDIGI